MILNVTKSARRYGYIIWSGATDSKMKELLDGLSSVSVVFNGFSIGTKNIDWKYHRISIGWKFTRALPDNATSYILNRKGEILEVITK